jgi:hypothetical protein
MCGMGRRGQGQMVTERAAAAESYAAARSPASLCQPEAFIWLAEQACQHRPGRVGNGPRGVHLYMQGAHCEACWGASGPR